MIVVRKGELGAVRRAPDEQSFAATEREFAASKRPALYFQDDTQNRILSKARSYTERLTVDTNGRKRRTVSFRMGRELKTQNTFPNNSV